MSFMITKFNQIGVSKLNITDNNGDIVGNIEISSNKLKFTIDGSTSDIMLDPPIQSLYAGSGDDFVNIDISNGGDFKFLGTTGTHSGSDLTFNMNLNNWSGKKVSGTIICTILGISTVYTRIAISGAKLINGTSTLPIGSSGFDIINYYSDGTYLYVSIGNSFA